MPPFLARHENFPLGRENVVINMSNIPSPAQPSTPTTDAPVGKNETLFGPPIGVSSNTTPDWAVSQESHAHTVPSQILKGWVAKRKTEVCTHRIAN